MSPGPIAVRLAEAALEPRLLQFVSRLSSEGAIRLRLERPMGMRASFEVEGYRTDFLAALRDDEIIGFASRSERLCYVNGAPTPQPVGVLGNLRIDPRYRSTMTFARGLKLLGELDGGGAAPFSIAFVQSENRAARALFEARRKRLPQFRDCGELLTCFLSGGGKCGRTGLLRIRPAAAEDVPLVLALHRRCGSERQFFPYYTDADVLGATPRLRGLRPSDILLCFAGERLVGCAARWSQGVFRTWVVGSYVPALRRLRPLYNAVAPRFGRLRLPAEGERFAYDFLALLCVEGHDPEVLRALLTGLTSRSAIPLVTTVHVRDPHTQEVQARSCFTLRSRMYLVHPANRDPQLDFARALHVEGGTI